MAAPSISVSADASCAEPLNAEQYAGHTHFFFTPAPGVEVCVHPTFTTWAWEDYRTITSSGGGFSTSRGLPAVIPGLVHNTVAPNMVPPGFGPIAHIELGPSKRLQIERILTRDGGDGRTIELLEPSRSGDEQMAMPGLPSYYYDN